jgi:hypothetical protein
MERKSRLRRTLAATLAAGVLATVAAFTGTAEAAASQHVAITGGLTIGRQGLFCPRTVNGPNIVVPASGNSTGWQWATECEDVRVIIRLAGRAVSSAEAKVQGEVTFQRRQCQETILGTNCEWSPAGSEPASGTIQIGSDQVFLAGWHNSIIATTGPEYEVEGNIFAMNWG